MLSDTHPEVEKVQIELLRRMTVAERLAAAFALTNMAVSLSRRAIVRANPHLAPQEADLLWVELHYGSKLAAAVRNHLAQK
jgi:hypothetical protein